MYFPNGSAGEVLDMQCADCPLGFGWHNPNQKVLFDAEPVPKPCPTAFIQMLFNYDQLNKGNEQLKEAMSLLIDDRGECQTRKLLLQCRAEQDARF